MDRKSGILLHISSLPTRYGIGSLGRAAYDFADFLRDAGQTYWQLLPLGPTGCGDSPYQSFSAFAGNPYFIDLELLAEDPATRKKLHMRMPLIRSLNDDMELMERTAEFYRAHRLAKVTLLPYHSMGVSKMEHIGGRQERYAPPEEEYAERIRTLFESVGMDSEISGIGRS